MRIVRFLSLSSIGLLLGLSLSARVKVGETLDARIETPHPIQGGSWSQSLEFPGAAFVKLHLGRLDVGPEDLLLVLDGKGREVYSHVGALRTGQWLPSIEGERCTVEIWGAKGSSPWGLDIDKVGYGYASPMVEGAVVPESQCGIDDTQYAACYQSDAGKWAAGDAVGRMLFQSGGLWYVCTGFLVSPSSQFLTNNHCISTETEAQSLEVRWRYQYSGCASGTLGTDSTSVGAHLIKTDYNLDYSLLSFTSDSPASRYGYITLNPVLPSVGDTMWIAEHPGGQPKRFAVVSDLDGGGNAKVQALNLFGNVAGSDIGYYADTAGGSSGSPVMDANNTVIALHHFGVNGTCGGSNMNQGVEMSKIFPQISSYLNSLSATATPTSGAPPLTVHFSCSPNFGTPPYTFDWDFGDGSGHSGEQSPDHIYSDEGEFSVVLTVHDDVGGTAVDRSMAISVVASPPQVSASASPTGGTFPLVVAFTSSVTGGTPPYTYDWAFGDGGAHSAEASPSHTYSSAGTYSVVLTVQDSLGHSATDSHLSIAVQSPPLITSVVKVGNPFRLKIYGSNFHEGCTVKIDGAAVPQTKWKNEGKVVAKKGRNLKAMVPKGVPVQITVTSSEGAVSAPFTYTR